MILNSLICKLINVQASMKEIFTYTVNGLSWKWEIGWWLQTYRSLKHKIEAHVRSLFHLALKKKEIICNRR